MRFHCNATRFRYKAIYRQGAGVLKLTLFDIMMSPKKIRKKKKGQCSINSQSLIHLFKYFLFFTICLFFFFICQPIQLKKSRCQLKTSCEHINFLNSTLVSLSLFHSPPTLTSFTLFTKENNLYLVSAMILKLDRTILFNQ